MVQATETTADSEANRAIGRLRSLLQHGHVRACATITKHRRLYYLSVVTQAAVDLCVQLVVAPIVLVFLELSGAAPLTTYMGLDRRYEWYFVGVVVVVALSVYVIRSVMDPSYNALLEFRAQHGACLRKMKQNGSGISTDTALAIVKDGQPFALYLRSFRAESRRFDSGVNFMASDGLSSGGVAFAKAIGGEVDNAIANIVQPLLPVVAIRNVNDPEPPALVRFVSATDDTWQELFQVFATSAAAIVIWLQHDTPGVMDELRFCRERGFQAKTLIVIQTFFLQQCLSSDEQALLDGFVVLRYRRPESAEASLRADLSEEIRRRGIAALTVNS